MVIAFLFWPVTRAAWLQSCCHSATWNLMGSTHFALAWAGMYRWAQVATTIIDRKQWSTVKMVPNETYLSNMFVLIFSYFIIFQISLLSFFDLPVPAELCQPFSRWQFGSCGDILTRNPLWTHVSKMAHVILSLEEVTPSLLGKTSNPEFWIIYIYMILWPHVWLPIPLHWFPSPTTFAWDMALSFWGWTMPKLKGNKWAVKLGLLPDETSTPYMFLVVDQALGSNFKSNTTTKH